MLCPLLWKVCCSGLSTHSLTLGLCSKHPSSEPFSETPPASLSQDSTSGGRLKPPNLRMVSGSWMLDLSHMTRFIPTVARQRLLPDHILREAWALWALEMSKRTDSQGSGQGLAQGSRPCPGAKQ